MTFTPSSRELGAVDRRRRARQRVRSAGGLGERDDVADRVAAGEQRDDPVEPEREPAVRRRAVAQRVEQEAEARLRLLLGDAERGEHLLLDLGAVDTDRAAADLDAVDHDVVAARAQRARVGEVAGRGGERMVHRVPAALGLVVLEHREVDDPQHVVAALGDEAEAPRQLQPQRAERRRRDLRLVGDEQQQVAGAAGELAGHGVALLVAQELRGRRAPRAVLLHERPHEPAGAVALDVLGQRVELRARHLARAGVEPADHAARLEHAREHLELGPRQLAARGRRARGRSACPAGRSRTAASPRRRRSAATAAAR